VDHATERRTLLLQCAAIRLGAATAWLVAAASLPRHYSHIVAAATDAAVAAAKRDRLSPSPATFAAATATATAAIVTTVADRTIGLPSGAWPESVSSGQSQRDRDRDLELVNDAAARDACASPRRQLLCAWLFGFAGLSLVTQATSPQPSARTPLPSHTPSNPAPFLPTHPAPTPRPTPRPRPPPRPALASTPTLHVAQSFVARTIGFGHGWRGTVSFEQGESHVLLALALGTYSIVTPSLPMMPSALFSLATLPLLLALFLALWWQTGDRGTSLLLGAELAKALAAEAVGVFVAYHDDRQTRDNYWSARLTNEIIYLQTRVRARAHNLLLNTLPAPIVQQIAQGTVSKISRYEDVAVLQCDLVGFTKLAQDHTPQQVVDFVSELFEAFDELADEFGADKIKTIGDAYVVCAGALSPCSEPEETIVQLALEMIAAVAAKSASRGLSVGARIGVHSGLVMGGIIGE